MDRWNKTSVPKLLMPLTVSSGSFGTIVVCLHLCAQFHPGEMKKRFMMHPKGDTLHGLIINNLDKHCNNNNDTNNYKNSCFWSSALHDAQCTRLFLNFSFPLYCRHDDASNCIQFIDTSICEKNENLKSNWGLLWNAGIAQRVRAIFLI